MNKYYIGAGFYTLRYKVSYKDGTLLVNYSEVKALSSDDLSKETLYYTKRFKEDSDVLNCEITFKPYKLIEEQE